MFSIFLIADIEYISLIKQHYTRSAMIMNTHQFMAASLWL